MCKERVGVCVRPGVRRATYCPRSTRRTGTVSSRSAVVCTRSTSVYTLDWRDCRPAKVPYLCSFTHFGFVLKSPTRSGPSIRSSKVPLSSGSPHPSRRRLPDSDRTLYCLPFYTIEVNFLAVVPFGFSYPDPDSVPLRPFPHVSPSPPSPVRTRRTLTHLSRV